MKDWKSEFANVIFQETVFHLFLITNINDMLERGVDKDGYTVNPCLNSGLTLDVTRALNKAKHGKAVGVEGLYNKVLKNQEVLPLLFSLFNACFLYGIIPSLWCKSII